MLAAPFYLKTQQHTRSPGLLKAGEKYPQKVAVPNQANKKMEATQVNLSLIKRMVYMERAIYKVAQKLGPADLRQNVLQ